MNMRRIYSLTLALAVILALFGCKPSIVSTSPSSPLIIRANTSTVFTVTAKGKGLTYAWVLDSVEQASTTNSFTYTPAITDVGTHTLKVTVSNKSGSVSASWNITVVLMAFAWENSYGGGGDDVATSVQQTEDGGFILAGYSNSSDIPGVVNHGDYDVYLIKLNGLGAVEWQAMYGGSGSDRAYDIALTADGGFIVAGTSESQDITGVTNNGGIDFYVIKLSSTGVVEWQDMFGGSGNDYARAVQVTKAGGYAIAGYSVSTLSSDGRLIKIDSSGIISWEQTYDTGSIEYIYGMKETTNGGGEATGFILTGSKYLLSGWVIRTDTSGDISWQDTYGGYPIYGCNLLGAQQVDDDFVVSGWVQKYDESGNNSPDACTLKYDDDGDMLWESLAGGTSLDTASALEKTPGGMAFIITGRTESDDLPDDSDITQVGDFDVYIGVLDSGGNCIFQERRGEVLALDDSGNAVVDVYNGGFYDGFLIAGQSGIPAAHDVYVLRYYMSD